MKNIQATIVAIMILASGTLFASKEAASTKKKRAALKIKILKVDADNTHIMTAVMKAALLKTEAFNELSKLSLMTEEMNSCDTAGYYTEAKNDQDKRERIIARHHCDNKVLELGLDAIQQFKAAKTPDALQQLRNKQFELWNKLYANCSDQQQIKAFGAINTLLANQPHIFSNPKTFKQELHRIKERAFRADILHDAIAKIREVSDFLQTISPKRHGSYLDMYQQLWANHIIHLDTAYGDSAVHRINSRVYQLLVLLGNYPQIFSEETPIEEIIEHQKTLKNDVLGITLRKLAAGEIAQQPDTLKSIRRLYITLRQAEIIREQEALQHDMLGLSKRLYANIKQQIDKQQIPGIIAGYITERQNILAHHQKTCNRELINKIRVVLVNDMQRTMEDILEGAVQLPPVHIAPNIPSRTTTPVTAGASPTVSTQTTASTPNTAQLSLPHSARTSPVTDSDVKQQDQNVSEHTTTLVPLTNKQEN